MTDEQLIEEMARAVSVKRMGTDENWQLYVVDQSAALAALRKTHHLIPRAAGDDGELVGRLRKIGERVPVVCPDGIKGCLVFHFRVETDPTCAEAADAITALSAEVERLTRLTEAMATALENNGHPSTAKSLRAALGAKP